MKIEVYDHLSENVSSDSMWSQGVCMDDWDYMLFTEDLSRFDFEDFHKSDDGRVNYATHGSTAWPKDYWVEQLLRGCCDNRWYKVSDFGGRSGVLGVAYHS